MLAYCHTYLKSGYGYQDDYTGSEGLCLYRALPAAMTASYFGTEALSWDYPEGGATVVNDC